MESRKQRFCKNCGTRIIGDAQFCSSCGTKIQDTANENKNFKETTEVPWTQLNTSTINNMQQNHAFANITMEKIQKELFSYCGRLNRLAYFQRVLIVLACIAMSLIIGVIMEELVGEVLADMLVSVVMLLCAIAGTMLGIRRCHDLDKPGWFVVLTYIPVVGAFVALYIWFAPGTKGTNRYGSDPLQDIN